MEAKVGKADWFVQRHPVFHTVGQLVDDDFCVVGKPIGSITIEPAATVIQRDAGAEQSSMSLS